MRSVVLFLILASLLSATLVKADKKISFSAEIIGSSSGSCSDVSYLSIDSFSLDDLSLDVAVTACRGDTLKRTVYLKVVDGANKTISSVEKFSLSKSESATKSFTFILKSCKDSAQIILYGLDQEARTTVDCRSVVGSAESSGDPASSTEVQPSAKISIDAASEEFTFNISFPSEVQSKEEFLVRVFLHNPSSAFFDIDAWAYVYRSSVSYSGDREANKKTVPVPEYSNITFDLPLTVTAEPGNYSLKFKLLLPGRKTPDELTFPIVVSAPSDDADMQSTPDSENASSPLTSLATLTTDSQQAYLSSSARSKKMLPFLIILALAILLSIIVFRYL